MRRSADCTATHPPSKPAHSILSLCLAGPGLARAAPGLHGCQRPWAAAAQLAGTGEGAEGGTLQWPDEVGMLQGPREVGCHGLALKLLDWTPPRHPASTQLHLLSVDSCGAGTRLASQSCEPGCMPIAAAPAECGELWRGRPGPRGAALPDRTAEPGHQVRTFSSPWESREKGYVAWGAARHERAADPVHRVCLEQQLQRLESWADLFVATTPGAHHSARQLAALAMRRASELHFPHLAATRAPPTPACQLWGTCGTSSASTSPSQVGGWEGAAGLLAGCAGLPQGFAWQWRHLTPLCTPACHPPALQTTPPPACVLALPATALIRRRERQRPALRAPPVLPALPQLRLTPLLRWVS